jgi:diguanylate cyclase (GGDEF)-like protein
MQDRTLEVLAVSPDRSLLRHLSRLLNVFGYRIRAAAGAAQARSAAEAAEVDILILDSGLSDALPLCRWFDERRSENHVYKMLLADTAGSLAVSRDAVLAGIDDLLIKPIVHGEVLARLRGGARILEQERRFRELARRDPLTGQRSRNGLIDEAERIWSDPQATGAPAACVVLDLDSFERFNITHGRPAADRVLIGVARALGELCGDTTLLGAFGGGRFAAIISRGAPRDAVEWAHRACGMIRDLPLFGGEPATQLTASGGTAAAEQASGTARRLIEQAETALLWAKRSGGDTVVQFAEHDEEDRRWAELAVPGKLFESTTARDVMAAVPWVFRNSDVAARAVKLLRKTGLRTAPVVGDDGALAGVLDSDLVDQDPQGPVCDVMQPSPVNFDEQTPFAALVDHFSRHASPYAVITCSGSPSGLLTPDQLAALSDRVTGATFAPTAAFDGSLRRYLTVAEKG